MKENQHAGKDAVFPVSLVCTPRFILLKMKKNEADIRFLRSLKYARWDPVSFCWTITNRSENLQMIRNYFGSRLHEEACGQDQIPAQKEQSPEVVRHCLMVVKYHHGRIRLIFRYDKELVKLIRQQAFYHWDAENRWWTLPHTETILRKLIDFCSQNSWEYTYLEDLKQINRKARIRPEDIPNYRQVPDSYLEALKVLRYSENTIKTYIRYIQSLLGHESPKTTQIYTHITTKGLDQIVNPLDKLGL